MSIIDAKALGAALNSEADTIEIEGDLAKKVVRIRATGKVAWIIAIGGIAIALVATIAAIPTGGTSEAIALAAMPTTIGILGVPAAIAAVSIAIGAGGVGVLGKLRDYREVSREDGRIVLRRR